MNLIQEADRPDGELRDPNGEESKRRLATGYRGMAFAWLKRDKLQPAIVCFRKSIEVDPTFREVYIDLGRILLHMRRWRDLEALCRHGLNYAMDLAELHKLMITALEERGSPADAHTRYALERRDRNIIDISPDEILCCVTVRNERARLPWFVDYYRQLGVDRFFFVDNGSTDGTFEWLTGEQDIHVWTSDLEFNRSNFGSAWFELLLRQHGVGHWCLTVDIDEFLVFEGSPERNLRTLCADLDRRDKRVATGLLLDLYGDRPIADAVYEDGQDPLSLCRYFDRRAYHSRSERAGQYGNQAVYFGGVRQRVFPTEHDYILSKAVLLRYTPDVVLTPGQHFTNVDEENIAADEICLLHFKFFSSFMNYARNEAAREVHAMAGEQYKAYLRVLKENRYLSLYDPSLSVRYENPQQLLDLGLLKPSMPAPPSAAPVIAPPMASGRGRPFWSVMITVHDRTHHLERALASVLSQAKDDAEVVVVCDPAGDQIRAEVAAIVGKFDADRVRLHALSGHVGHPQIFNLCIEQSTGRWVHILHDDDWLEPGFYSALREGAESSTQVGATFSQHRIISEESWGRDVWESWVERETPGVVENWLERIAIHCRVQFSAMVVRRDVYEAVGGFRADVRSAFDWELWARIASGYAVWFVPRTLVNVGRDAGAETFKLLRSGRQILDAYDAADIIAAQLPEEHAVAFARKTREEIARHALSTARKYSEHGDAEAALSNLRAAVARTPSDRVQRWLVEYFQETEREF